MTVASHSTSNSNQCVSTPKTCLMKGTSRPCLRAYQPIRLLLDDQINIPDRFDSAPDAAQDGLGSREEPSEAVHEACARTVGHAQNKTRPQYLRSSMGASISACSKVRHNPSSLLIRNLNLFRFRLSTIGYTTIRYTTTMIPSGSLGN